MATASAVFAILKARLEANKPNGLGDLRWQNEDGSALPDTPAAFAYTEFLADRAAIAGFGGGRGNNLYRNPGRLVVYVFVPRGQGLAAATDLAESAAAVFRSYRDSSVSCFEATVYPGGDGAALSPPGIGSEANNYFYAVAEISLFFDLIG